MNKQPSRKIYQLDDKTLQVILKLLQLAFLSNTDLTDHFRFIRLEQSTADQNQLTVTPEFCEWFDKTLANQLKEIQEFAEEAQKEIQGPVENTQPTATN